MFLKKKMHCVLSLWDESHYYAYGQAEVSECAHAHT